MPKLKTHSGAAKRFHKTGTGKVKRGQTKMRHILTSKATKTKRKLGGSCMVSEADLPKVLRMIPYA
jgi:large subunit ribosomal protein L35